MNPSTPAPSRNPVLLTGATGFIGRRIQRTLIEAGFTLRILVRPGSLNRQFIASECEVIEGDLHDPDILTRAVSRVTAVIYAAGTVRGKRLTDFLPANVDGVHAVTQAAAAEPAEIPFLLVSSLAASRPTLSDYANSKHLGEQKLQQGALEYWTILRPPAVYGPGDREMAPILRLARRGIVFVPGPADQRFSLIHADDLANAILAWLQSWKNCKRSIYAVDDGCRSGYDWKQIVRSAGASRFIRLPVPKKLLTAIAGVNRLAAEVIDYSPMLTPGKVRELTQARWLCDNTDFSRDTGWHPQIKLPMGIKSQLDSTS